MKTPAQPASGEPTQEQRAFVDRLLNECGPEYLAGWTLRAATLLVERDAQAEARIRDLEDQLRINSLTRSDQEDEIKRLEERVRELEAELAKARAEARSDCEAWAKVHGEDLDTILRLRREKREIEEQDQRTAELLAAGHATSVKFQAENESLRALVADSRGVVEAVRLVVDVREACALGKADPRENEFSRGWSEGILGFAKELRAALSASPTPAATVEPQRWWGVWCERDGEPGFWREYVRGVPLQTTETEARRLAARANEYQETRWDSLGWRYEARIDAPGPELMQPAGPSLPAVGSWVRVTDAALRDAQSEARVRELQERLANVGQVVLEAMRLVAGKGSPCEPCGECGMPGIGPMRDALRAALGPDWGKLIWGNDGNATAEFRMLFSELPQPPKGDPRFPAWFVMSRHGDSPLLYACAHAGMTAEQALDELAKESAQRLGHIQKLMAMQPGPPIIIEQSTPLAGQSKEAGHEWAPHEREGWSVCSRCGMVRNYDRETPCRGAPPAVRMRAGGADPNPTSGEWRVVDSYSTGGGIADSWRAIGPWRASEEEARRDAEHGSMRGALAENATVYGPPLYRCTRCGHPAADHATDDEERRECTACECEQYDCLPFGAGEPTFVASHTFSAGRCTRCGANWDDLAQRFAPCTAGVAP